MPDRPSTFEHTVAHLLRSLAGSLADVAGMLRFRATHLQEADELDRLSHDLQNVAIAIGEGR